MEREEDERAEFYAAHGIREEPESRDQVENKRARVFDIWYIAMVSVLCLCAIFMSLRSVRGRRHRIPICIDPLPDRVGVPTNMLGVIWDTLLHRHRKECVIHETKQCLPNKLHTMEDMIPPDGVGVARSAVQLINSLAYDSLSTC
jgi:hypothetical protein